MITTEGKIKQNFYFESCPEFDFIIFKTWLDINE